MHAPCIARLASLSQYFNAELVVTYTARIHGQRASSAMARAVAGYSDGPCLECSHTFLLRRAALRGRGVEHAVWAADVGLPVRGRPRHAALAVPAGHH